MSTDKKKARGRVFARTERAARIAAVPRRVGPLLLEPLVEGFPRGERPVLLRSFHRRPLTPDNRHRDTPLSARACTEVLYAQGLEVSGGLRTRRLGGGRAARGRTYSQAPHTDHCDNNPRHKRQPNEHWQRAQPCKLCKVFRAARVNSFRRSPGDADALAHPRLGRPPRPRRPYLRRTDRSDDGRHKKVDGHSEPFCQDCRETE